MSWFDLRLQHLALALALSAPSAGMASERPLVLAPPARPTVVLLTSLPAEGARAFYLHLPFLRTTRRLERVFREEFEGTGLTLSIRHGADQFEAWNALRSSENIAVLWVSHAGRGAIADSRGNDLRDVFQAAHPGLRVLALVGCDTAPVAAALARDGAFDHAPGTKVISFEGKRSATSALRDAARATLMQLTRAARRPPGACVVKRGLPLLIRRDAGARAAPPVRIIAGGKLLTVLPRLEAGQSQTQEALFESDGDLSSSDLDLVADSGALQSPPELGSISVSASWSGAGWVLFGKPDGTPFGTRRHVLRYAGTRRPVPEDSLKSWQPYPCL